MGLVKKSKLKRAPAKKVAKPKPSQAGVLAPHAKGGTRGKAAERIAAATEELASGITEAATAAEELRRSMEQIAAGAEEAAGSSQAQLNSVRAVSASLQTSREDAEAARRRTQSVSTVLAESSGQITLSVQAVERNAKRQLATLGVIAALEASARDIASVAKTVSKLSDQTNLLALNAAIEAARAGEHGRGFAVVAEEVRALAETSEKSASDVQGLADDIEVQVRSVSEAVQQSSDVAAREVDSGRAVAEVLETLRQDLSALVAGAEETLNASMESERAAMEAQRGAEQVQSAAEEQAAASNQSLAAVEQQAKALEQGQTAAHALAKSASKLTSRQAGAVTYQIASAAEQLSATVQELSSAATEITASVEQISRGAEQQSAATHQTSAALSQIENGAKLAQRNAGVARERVGALEASLKKCRDTIDKLVQGVASVKDVTDAGLKTLAQLEALAGRIEKLIDAIALVAMQTTMLAVSGSVEAARAGAAGRGFSLVSKDIRGLAREAAEASDSAKDNVRLILTQISELRRDLEQSSDIAQREIENSVGVTRTLAQLNADVDALRGANDSIVEGADAILVAAADMASASRQIAAAAEEAGNAAKQAALVSEEQAHAAEDLAAAVEEIASLADELRQAHA